MAFIFGDLKTKLQTQVGDSNLNDSVAGDALNYAQQEIFNKFDLTLNSSQQTNAVAAGANSLTNALPTDLQRITNLYVTSPVAYIGSLKQYFLSPDQFRQLYPSVIYTGPLQWWTFWTSVEFSTLASLAYVVKLDYTKYVPILSASSDIPTMPQPYEELLMLGAKIRVYEQKEDFDYAAQFGNRYADMLEDFVTRYSKRQVDVQGNVRSSRFRAARRGH